MERIIIDTDPGVDDAHAIMMALAYPGVKVEALTVVGGNVGLANTVANACKVLDVMAADVPVYAGCERPFLHPAENAAHVHGDDGLGDAGLPPSQRIVESEHASAALVRMVNEAPGELTLVALGPLTNVAVALKLDPALPEKLKRLVIMGGAIHAHGNTRNVSAEFNIYADPEAAYLVFEAWPQLTMVSWETTVAQGFPMELMQEWMAWENPRARFFRSIITKTLLLLGQKFGRPLFYGADELAMAVALEPEIVQEVKEHFVSVELNGRYTRGQTTVDWDDFTGLPANANIILKVDQERFVALMEQGLA